MSGLVKFKNESHGDEVNAMGNKCAFDSVDNIVDDIEE
jgi:hypothetical protein